MYKSYVYDGNGKRTGEVYKAYVSVTYYGGKTKLSNGKSAVKIGDNATINIHHGK
ncbi:SLAP domain-containing protein [Lactobacillus helveticus]|nr:SLAP domain-containing protein [Lactobacillus helveticus]